jgi:hypothetical protein
MNEEIPAKHDRTNMMWRYALIIFGVVYLSFEWGYNAFLVDHAYDFGSGAVDIETVERYGRSMAAFGLCLLLLKLFLPKLNVSMKRYGRVLVILLVAFPAMYFGQKLLVDFLVARTDAPQRMQAQYLLLLKTGLANGAVAFEGIELSEEERNAIAAKSFISTIGVMTFMSQDFIDNLARNTDLILDRVALHQASKILPDFYQGYLDSQGEMERFYGRYLEVVTKREDAMAALDDEAFAAWAKLNAELAGEYQAQAERFSPASINRMTSEFLDKYRQYRSYKKRCRGKRCDQVEAEYRSAVQDAFGRYVEPKYWCMDDEVRTTIERSGYSVAEKQAVIPGRCDDLEFTHFRARMTALLGAAQDYESFLENEQVYAQTLAKLQEQGLTMPRGWALNDRAGFVEAYKDTKSRGIDDEIRRAMQAEIGFIMPFNLNAEAFISHPDIQSRWAQALKIEGEPAFRETPLRLNMTSDEVLNAYLLPPARAKADERREALMADMPLFADGAPRAAEGKAYVKALIVPPIAMLFSLLFSVLNFISLVADVLKIALRKAWPAMLFKVLFVVALLGLPMIMPSPLTQQPSFKYFADQMTRNASPFASYASKWLITMQPVLHPIGAASGGLVNGITPLTDIKESAREEGREE